VEHDFEIMTQHALNEPGKLQEAYSRLHEFSLQNQFLAMMQMSKIEPIASYNDWKEIVRQVRKGSRGIALMMPIFKKAKEEVTESARCHPVFFQMRRYWFPLSATDGKEYTPPRSQVSTKTPCWQPAR
jgi:N-terminal domain of anti-restriction factor ArdC